MSITDAVLIALALLICGTYWKLSKRLQEQGSRMGAVLLSLAEQIAHLKGAVEEAARPEAEKYERRERKAFDRAEALTLGYLRQLKSGAVLRLISCSWYYPSEFPDFDRFEYRHDHINEQSATEFGYEVHGLRRPSPLEEWKPYHFLATETEASTSSCSGTIKRLP